MEIGAKGFKQLSSEDMSEIDGGVLGTALAVGYVAFRVYRIPVVRTVVNNTVKTGLAAAGTYVGWTQTN